jgi:RimJ/RimL family protein N-acetyltransferase
MQKQNSTTPAVGEPVDTAPAPRPELVALPGRFVSLVPLAAEHADDLVEASHGPEVERLWAYMSDGPYAEPEAFRQGIAAKAASADPFWAVVDAASGRAVGYLSLMRIEPAHRVIEIGNILYTPALQRTPGATEAVFLAARYVFDRLGYRRLEWKCNDLNAPSRRAALRFGFTFEGIFRQHMIIKGRNRDTAWYAMLDRDWPARRAAFEQWLAPENFGVDGVQKTSLATINGVAAG